VETSSVAPVFPADLLPVQRRATLTYRLARVILLPLFHALFSIRIEGRHNIPRNQPLVVIANHLAWLDPFLLTAALPAEPRIHFLAVPGNLAQRRVQWWFVRKMGGYIPVNRGGSGADLFEHVDRCLRAGGIVALFPEGHGGPVEGGLEPFKKGFARFAIENDIPVLPIALSGVKELWLRKPVRVVIGEPILPAGHSTGSLVAEGYARVKELLPEYHEPGGPKLLRRWLTELFL
jgi:1-acyl-sn-glycerol-3-phosphate acyltransferase